MIRKTIAAFIMIALCPGAASAEVYKCVTDAGPTIFSDKPCGKGNHQKIKLKVPPLNEVGYAKYTMGLITGYTGTIQIKDSIAHIKKTDKTIEVDLWLFPFRLNTEEVEQVKKGALVERGTQLPARFNFSFAANLSNDISYKDVTFAGLSLANGTLVTASAGQWYTLAKSIKLQYLPAEGKLSFSIKGKIDNYSLFINTKSYTYEKEIKSVNKEWAEPRGEQVFHSSVFGMLNYPYQVRPDLLAKGPSFTIKDTQADKWVSYKKLNYDTFTRTYSLSGLKPSTYRIHASLEDSTEFRGAPVKPGEMYAHKEFVLEDENKPVRVDLNMISMIHLVKPVNNNYHIPLTERKSYSSPLEFVWKPLSEGALYKCVIKRVNRIKNHTSLDVHMAIDIRQSNLTVNLTPGLYHFVLSAYKNDVKSGEMRIHDDRAIGFEYVFLVKEK